MPATAATVRKGAIHRATASAAEDITPGKLALQRSERQSPTAGDGPPSIQVVVLKRIRDRRNTFRYPIVPIYELVKMGVAPMEGQFS